MLVFTCTVVVSGITMKKKNTVAHISPTMMIKHHQVAILISAKLPQTISGLLASRVEPSGVRFSLARSGKGDPTRPDTTWPDRTGSDPTRPDPARLDPTRPVIVHEFPLPVHVLGHSPWRALQNINKTTHVPRKDHNDLLTYLEKCEPMSSFQFTAAVRRYRSMFSKEYIWTFALLLKTTSRVCFQSPFVAQPGTWADWGGSSSCPHQNRVGPALLSFPQKPFHTE